MSLRPWLKFYPADWQSDELLGMCTLAARGLWIEMIGIMHKADPYGHLVVNGRPPTDTQLAALARCPPDQIPSLLEELENAGVFSRTRTRVIYSRRMTRDERRSKDGRNAKINAMNTASSQMPQGNENIDEKCRPSRVPIRESPRGGSPQRPESRYQSENTAAETAESVPRSQRSPAAGYAFEGQIIRLTQIDFDRWRKDFHGIADLAAELRVIDAKFVDDGVTGKWFGRCSAWLRARHDALLKAKAEPENYEAGSEEHWRDRLAHWKGDSAHWPNSWGPMPGLRGCRAPPEVLREFGLETVG